MPWEFEFVDERSPTQMDEERDLLSSRERNISRKVVQ